MAKLTDAERLHRASRAKEIVESEVFIEAVANVDALYISAWRNAKSIEAREDLHRKIIALYDMSKDLKSMMFDGAVTDKRIVELEGRKGWLR